MRVLSILARSSSGEKLRSEGLEDEGELEGPETRPAAASIVLQTRND